MAEWRAWLSQADYVVLATPAGWAHRLDPGSSALVRPQLRGGERARMAPPSTAGPTAPVHGRSSGLSASEEALLAVVREADRGPGVVALALDLEHHALVRSGRARRRRPARGRGARHRWWRRRPARRGVGRLNARPAGRLRPSRPRGGRGPAADHDAVADVLDQLLGDLLQEPAREALLDAAEEQPAPGVGEVEPLAGTGHSDVAEAPLLLELVRLAQASGSGGRSPPPSR